MFKFKHLLIVCSIVLFVTGCSTTPSHDAKLSLKDNEQIFDHNQSRLSNLETWEFDGRFSIKSPSGTESAHLTWLQEDTRYLLKISGPLQQGAVFLKGDDGIISYKDSKGVTDTATSPEALLKRHTSYDLPISSLRYWVIGQYDPGYPYHLNISRKGDLKMLSQQGWIINYEAFENADPYRLPTKMTMTNSNAGIKIVLSIYDWNPDLITGY